MKKLLLTSAILLGTTSVFASEGFIKEVSISYSDVENEIAGYTEDGDAFGVKLTTSNFGVKYLTPSFEFEKEEDLYTLSANLEYDIIKFSNGLYGYVDGELQYQNDDEVDYDTTNILMGAGMKLKLPQLLKGELKVGYKYGVGTGDDLDNIQQLYAETSFELAKDIRLGVGIEDTAYEFDGGDIDSQAIKFTIAKRF